MQAYGSDRVRETGGRIVLHSRLSKGWTPRTLKTATHAEFPGTAVLWDDRYFEVIAADLLPAGGVRYVLADWRDDHTIRQFVTYDEASEAALLADFEKAARQRKHSMLARLSGVVLGHLPEKVQNRLANELGVSPSRMTLLSCLSAVILFSAVIWMSVSDFMAMRLPRVPIWLAFFSLFMMVDSAVRFMVAMSQMRGMGSLPGSIAYTVYCMIAGKKDELVPPPPALAPVEPDPEVVARDSIEMRSWMVTLLSPAEQNLLATTIGYDYRKDASSVAWALLGCGVIGMLSLISKLGRVSAMLSFLCAGAVVLEQALRLAAFKRGPAGSIFGIFVRPFVRDLLERR